MGTKRAEALIRKYLEGTATPDEEALLESWYILAAGEQPAMESVADHEKIGAEILAALRAEQDGSSRKEKGDSGQKGKGVIRLWPRIVAAACILAVVVGSVYLFRDRVKQHGVEIPVAANDIMPAGLKATLTLNDGKEVFLDSTKRPDLARQGAAVIGSDSGQLTYSKGIDAGYNTLTTKPGEHYSVMLADGTKVWLNAGSSIRYPVAFNGYERRVMVTGEAYFEIVHDAKQPFRILVGDQEIEDIGTYLNVHAYNDEPGIRTTLVEGSIRVVKKSGPAVVLKPGQEAEANVGDSLLHVKDVDADAAMGWKNGLFYFDRADIKTVMREMARWYDLRVIYKGEVPKRVFKGKVYRNIRASEALGILSYFGAHFQIEGRTITVSVQ